MASEEWKVLQTKAADRCIIIKQVRWRREHCMKETQMKRTKLQNNSVCRDVTFKEYFQALLEKVTYLKYICCRKCIKEKKTKLLLQQF